MRSDDLILCLYTYVRMYPGRRLTHEHR